MFTAVFFVALGFGIAGRSAGRTSSVHVLKIYGESLGDFGGDKDLAVASWALRM